MDEIDDQFRNLLAAHGVNAMLGEPECVWWRSKHENCHGCPHELGCKKLVSSMLVYISARAYRPHSFEDHLKMQAHVADLIKQICAAETAEEINRLASGAS